MSATTLRFDRDQINRAVGLFLEPGSTIEMRCPSTDRGVVSGYFNEAGALVKHAAQWSGRAESVYVTLNPVLPDLRARANNRCRDYVKSGHTTTDKQITERRWFLVDFDAVRPAGISSTDTEHQAAHERAIGCRDWLSSFGWPAPVYADSGNGAHLLYRVELPNDAAAEQALRAGLAAIAAKFSDDMVGVDQTTFNASRLCKLYGTLAAKGDSVPDLGRVHRLARLLDVPAEIHPVDLGEAS